MVVCQYFLRGTCKFGNTCRNEHRSDQKNVFGGGGSGGGGGFLRDSKFGSGNDKYHYNSKGEETLIPKPPSECTSPPESPENHEIIIPLDDAIIDITHTLIPIEEKLIEIKRYDISYHEPHIEIHKTNSTDEISISLRKTIDNNDEIPIELDRLESISTEPEVEILNFVSVACQTDDGHLCCKSCEYVQNRFNRLPKRIQRQYNNFYDKDPNNNNNVRKRRNSDYDKDPNNNIPRKRRNSDFVPTRTETLWKRVRNNNYNDPRLFKFVSVQPSSGGVFGQSANNNTVDAIIQLVRTELLSWDTNKVWPISCFAAQKEQKCLKGLADTSPEELRVEAYNCQASGSLQPYLQGIAALANQTMSRRNELKAMNNTQLMNEIEDAKSTSSQLSSTKSTGLFSSNSTGGLFSSGSKNLFSSNTTNSNNLFGGNSSSNIFGSNNNTSSGLFGNNNNNTSNNLFGSSNSNSGNIFGNNNSNSTNIFGSKPSNSNNTGGLFSSQPGSSVFGSSQLNSNVFGSNQSKSGSLFSSNQNSTSMSGGLFSSNANNSTGSLFSSNQNSGGLFSSNQSKSGGLFSSNQNSGGLFSSNQNNTNTGLFSSASGGGLFQNSNNSNSGGVFGGNTTISNPFATQNSGGDPTNETKNLFGNSAVDNSSSSGFASMSTQSGSANSTQLPTPFGSQNTTPAPANPFLAQLEKSNQVKFENEQKKYESLQVQKSDDDFQSVVKLPDITDKDLESFQADTFEFGKIPTCPPPAEYCH